MKVISSLLGDAVLPESIDRFKGGAGGDNHALAELVGKLLVYDDDLSRNTVLPDGTLKKLSEDGQLTANPKGVQGFKFTKVCTVAMLSNGFPSTRDISRGFRRRAMVIPFNRGFHEQGAITDLAEQIAEKEIAGVLNRALAGLQRLRARTKFLEPTSCKLAKEAWLNESNPVALFISERVTVTEDYNDTVELSDAYRIFSHWAMSYNFKRMGTKQQFRSAMEDMDIIYTSARANKKVFRYIKIEEEIVDDFDQDL
jgi:putative DNA primase/helicase